MVQKGLLKTSVQPILQIIYADEWSDKVFTSTYPLHPLSSVETYINQYGHLSNVPSGEQVVNDGIDPARMDAKLLEKIEELTLYSIQLEKENREQKVINQQQQTRLDQLEQLVKQLLEKK